jgi:hypothetical protein
VSVTTLPLAAQEGAKPPSDHSQPAPIDDLAVKPAKKKLVKSKNGKFVPVPPDAIFPTGANQPHHPHHPHADAPLVGESGGTGAPPSSPAGAGISAEELAEMRKQL